MAYESVKNQIDAYIKANGVNLITGPVLNAVLTTMLDELGEGYAFQGALNTTDTPSPAADIPQAWLASAGTYLGGSITVDEDELALIIHTADGWSKETVYRGIQLSYDAIVEALGYTPADEANLAEKQDTIADLPAIRSGAALGSTSVQPADIENMVEAEPIGSIIPPVNPSEFATREELSQLDQEVGDFSGYDYSGYQQFPINVVTGHYWNFSQDKAVESDLYHYVSIPVVEGEKYKISGWNGNNTIPCACLYTEGRASGIRLISSASAHAVSEEEVVIPTGYVELIVNGIESSPIALQKWVTVAGSASVAVAALDSKVGPGDVDDSIYEDVSALKVEGKYIALNLTITDSAPYEYAAIDVNAGDAYYIEGWNINSSIPCCVLANTSSNTSMRGLFDSSSKALNGVVIVPDGYDKMYINGNVDQNVPAVVKKKISSTNLTDAAKILQLRLSTFSEQIASLCAIFNEKDIYAGNDKAFSLYVIRRWDENNDIAWCFENKTPTPNSYFDLRLVGLVPRGEDKIQNFVNVSNTTILVQSMSDFISPICVGAVANKDGDYPDDVSMFTGGAHGYNNSSASSASATMRQISRRIIMDGKPLVAGERIYGNVVDIDVVNNIQGCNTEKADGSGREIIQQHIHIRIDRNHINVDVTFTALEDVNIYTIEGLSQVFAFSGARFIGSTTMRGLYTAGQRAVTEDKHTNIIRCIGDNYYFDVEMDRTYGIAQDGGLATYNALATIANKGYFHLIGDTPLALAAGESVTFRGGYALGKVPATS